MDQDLVFRNALVAAVLIVFPIAIAYRIKSRGSGEKLDRSQEGLFILATLRPLGVAMWVAMITYMIDPSRMAWASVALPAWLRWIGFGLFAAAGGLVLWSFHTLGSNLTDTVVTRKAHTLVTRGPYQWVRHPFYGSVALLVAGSSLVTANWFLLLTGGLVLALLIVRTRTEEEKLVARFGDDYRRYMARTGRFLPHARSLVRRQPD